MLTWLRRSKPAEDRALTRESLPPVMLADPVGTEAASSPRAALALADVFANVNAIVSTCSTLPLEALDGDAEPSDGPVAELLAAPAPGVTPAALMGALFSELVLSGDGFLGCFRDAAGDISQLDVIASERVTVERKAGLPLFTVTTTDGRQSTVGERDVIHARVPLSLDGLRGLSPLRLCRDAIATNAALARHTAETVANGAVPPGVVKVAPGPGQEELMANLRAGLTRMQSDPRRAARLAVVGGELAFERLGYEPAAIQLAELRKQSTAEIARMLAVPPSLVNAQSQDSLTYSTVESEALAFLRNLRPLLVAVEQAVSAHPELCPGPVHVRFNADELLRTDAKTRAEIARMEAETRRADPAVEALP